MGFIRIQLKSMGNFMRQFSSCWLWGLFELSWSFGRGWLRVPPVLKPGCETMSFACRQLGGEPSSRTVALTSWLPGSLAQNSGFLLAVRSCGRKKKWVRGPWPVCFVCDVHTDGCRPQVVPMVPHLLQEWRWWMFPPSLPFSPPRQPSAQVTMRCSWSQLSLMGCLYADVLQQLNCQGALLILWWVLLLKWG